MRMRDLQLLVRVAETRSMSKAGVQLNVSPASVSGVIRKVEEELGLRVFERTTRSLKTTAEGELLVSGCREIVQQWEELVERTKGHRDELTGTVHLSAPTDTMHGYLAAVAVKMCAEHPGLRVVFDVSDSVQHLHEQGIDLAIRFGAMPDSTLAARRLVSFPTVLVASPTYLQTHGTPTVLAELTDHRCLTLRIGGQPKTHWVLQHNGEQASVDVSSPLCGDGQLVRSWAVDGLGIAFKGLFDVIDDLESGRLVQVLPGHLGEPMPVYMVFPSRRHPSVRVTVVSERIADAFMRRGQRCERWLEQL